jgi:uncharacterized membrane protein HdeD (DUF308 family)
MDQLVMGALAMDSDLGMDKFVMGALAMALAVAGLFFLRFWKQTRDRLFLIFAVAFWLLGLTRIALALTPQSQEHHSYVYLIRLLAFVLILLAIADKNLARKTP